MKEASTYADVLIIGAGQAGIQVALSLRQQKYLGRIIVINEEQHLPYQRPPLSKEYMLPGSQHGVLPLRAMKVYERQNIEIIFGSRVESINEDSRTVSLEQGQSLTYEWMILATGGKARRLFEENPDDERAHHAKNIHYLRTVDDAINLRNALETAENVTVVGGGFIGMEFAANARQHGCNVSVIVKHDRILARTATPEISNFLANHHLSKGVSIYTNTEIEKLVQANDSIFHIECRDGSELKADMIVAGIGMNPNISLAQSIGLEIRNNAIFVDELSRTSSNNILAVGDCTSFNSWVDGSVTRHESVSNAIDQAKAAAALIMNDLSHKRPEPWFWSDQYDLKLQSVGLIKADDDVQIKHYEEDDSLSVTHMRDGKIIGASFINRPVDFMRARKELSYLNDL